MMITFGEKAYQDKGKEHWNERIEKAIDILKNSFLTTTVYI